MDDVDYLALCRSLLHIPQPNIRHGSFVLLAGSTSACNVQRTARTLPVAQQVLLLLLSNPHGTNRFVGPIGVGELSGNKSKNDVANTFQSEYLCSNIMN